SSAKCPSLHQRKQTLASTNLVAVCRSERLVLPPPSHSRTTIFVLSAFVTSLSPSPVRSHQLPVRRRPLRSTALRRPSKVDFKLRFSSNNDTDNWNNLTIGLFMENIYIIFIFY
ncbi:hypothetical protein S245_063861, partial [Arachis hypogaea]